jgi:aspartate aminotransferase-like enzyme/GNAT superfamily N-acetyltransferase
VWKGNVFVYVFKFADQESEIEQIHRLNYAAFVEEIPQHAPNPERRLVDQFHDENTYAIALEGEQVVAMLALRSNRPFSLDRKLENLDSHLPPHRSLCEIRLLYVLPNHRNGKIMKGLMEMIAQYAVGHGHDMGLISGTTRQERFYKHLGFVPFGPLVGTGDALFQPMYLTVEAAIRQSPWVQALRTDGSEGSKHNPGVHHAILRETGLASPLPKYDPPVNYLPGPVNIPPNVMAEMSKTMISHRDGKFLEDVAAVQARLCALVRASYVEFLFGSGTLGNEAIAGQLSLLGSRGLILVNGEFGQRLLDQARRWRLPFDVISVEWGQPFDLEQIDQYLATHSEIGWLWCNHSETSTGILNDLPGLVSVCTAHDVKLCVDCMSSLGVVDLDLSQVYLASATSGKALGAVTGLAIVFYNTPFEPAPEGVPSYLDLGAYRQAKGVPFTINTNLVYALAAALDTFSERNYHALAKDAAALRAALREMGLNVLTPDEVASPAVTTIVLPPSVSSVAVGDRLAEQGFLLSYRSRYLVARNWIQICLMGDYRTDAFSDLLRLLGHLIPSEERVAA